MKQLKVVHKVVPRYPRRAKVARVEGNVVLDVEVNKKGEVTDARVVSGPSLLRHATVDAVKQWRYAPSPLLPAETTVHVNYSLIDQPPETQRMGPPRVQLRYRYVANFNETGAQPKNVYKIGGDVQAPKLVYSTDPPYTKEASKAKLSGDVVVSVIVTPEGRVTQIKEVSKPLGMGLDESAENILRT